ncbi:hypothetical protein [Streptomyces fructofermentans]|uniref:Uncharacterized protein n=1 Tax=Streptomyces fructofermentans TaxID=152141 RepID=A0A918NWH5_9ACTN|nr:hypothetical protein [Streptomyces fructofermentans]GGX99251.1 hypothetical protein GCM10010515_76800 [Streptomyces fructofermentans]
MQHFKRAHLVIAGIVLAAGLAVSIYFIAQPTYDEIATNCASALEDRPKGDKQKPPECDGLKKDDYDALLMSQVLDDLGWTDDEGRFDKNKMLENSP